ncbi:MAG: hypothetical protein ACRCZ9_12410 [Fusobacteriaceae bacterium]
MGLLNELVYDRKEAKRLATACKKDYMNNSTRYVRVVVYKMYDGVKINGYTVVAHSEVESSKVIARFNI